MIENVLMRAKHKKTMRTKDTFIIEFLWGPRWRLYFLWGVCHNQNVRKLICSYLKKITFKHVKCNQDAMLQFMAFNRCFKWEEYSFSRILRFIIWLVFDAPHLLFLFSYEWTSPKTSTSVILKRFLKNSLKIIWRFFTGLFSKSLIFSSLSIILL